MFATDNRGHEWRIESILSSPKWLTLKECAARVYVNVDHLRVYGCYTGRVRAVQIGGGKRGTWYVFLPDAIEKWGCKQVPTTQP